MARDVLSGRAMTMGLRTVAVVIALSLVVAPARGEADDGTSDAPGRALHELAAFYSPRGLVRDDALLSPRAYRGFAPLAVTFAYGRDRASDGHRLRVDYSASTFATQSSFTYQSWPDGSEARSEASPFTFIRVDYAYLRAVHLRESLTVRAGGAVDCDLQKMDVVYHPYANPAYLGAFTLDGRAEAEWRRGQRHRVRIEASVPLAGWVTRSPYALQDDASIRDNGDHRPARTFFRYVGAGEAQTWNRLRAIRFGATYVVRPRGTWGASVGVNVRVLANTIPRSLVMTEYGLLLGVGRAFGVSP